MSVKKISRRDMLKGIGLGAASLVVASCTPAAQPTSQSAATTNPAAPTSKPPAAEPVSIQFAGWGNAEECQLYQDIATAHMQEDSKIKIEVLCMPNADYNQKIFAWIASGDAPDNLRTGTQYFPTLVTDGGLLDLTSYFKASPDLLDDKLYFTDLYSIYTVANKMYGSVLGPNVFAGYYNIDLFQKAKMDFPTATWTFEDYRAAAVKLTSGDGAGKVWGSSPSFINRENWQSQIWARGGEIFDKDEYPTKCLLNSKEAIDTFKWMQDMVNKDKAAPNTADFSAIQGGFISGMIGMELTGTWEINARRKLTAFKWDIFPFPKDAKHVTAYLAGAVVVPKTSKNPDAAWSHTAYIQSEKAQTLIAASGLNAPMSRKVANSDAFLKLDGAPAHHTIVTDEMAFARNRDFFFPKWAEVQSKVWLPEIEKLMLNKQTPEDTAKNIADGTQALL